MTNADKKALKKSKKLAAREEFLKMIKNSSGCKPIEFLSLEEGVTKYNDELAFNDFIQ